MTIDVRPGDVLTVHDATFWAEVIRLGPEIHNLLLHDHQPANWNHVLIVMPPDAAGRRWAVEGRPGGFGYRDLGEAGYLRSPLTLSNAEQPKSDQQRDLICQLGDAMAVRKVNYDWPAIVVDTINELQPLWQIKGRWGPNMTSPNVCSSGAQRICKKVGLAAPAGDQFCPPWAWAAWDLTKGWLQ